MLDSETTPPPASLDDVAEALIRMRMDAGSVSFTEIAARIQQRREAMGLEPLAARIPRSTVYDAFQTGRRRIDPDLVAEIVLALGSDDETSARWRDVAIDAMKVPQQARPADAETGVSTASPPAGPAVPVPETRSATTLLAVFIACVFVNIFVHVPVDPLGLPVYLDMIGTAIAAIALGPWLGAAVGLTSNLLSSTVIMDWPGMWFALVNATGGLLWGLGYHRWRMRTPVRFLALSAGVALGCTMVAVPVLVFVFGGSMGTSQDTIISIAGLVGAELWSTVFSANMLTSFADKMFSGAVALTVCAAAALILRRRRARAAH